MEPYQQRVVDEKDELVGKLARLILFIESPGYDQLPLKEKERMYRQLLIMELYDQVLAERINAFPEPEPLPQNDTRE